MRSHNLKCWPEYFSEMARGTKSFELRHNDRAYQIGDILILQEFRPCRSCQGKGKSFVHPADRARGVQPMLCFDCGGTGGSYTGSTIRADVTYVLDKHQGLVIEYVVLGLRVTATLI